MCVLWSLNRGREPVYVYFMLSLCTGGESRLQRFHHIAPFFPLHFCPQFGDYQIKTHISDPIYKLFGIYAVYKMYFHDK